jgi:HEAT repeat protein
MHALLPLMTTRTEWPLTRLEAMLSEVGPVVVTRALVAAAETAPAATLPRLIALMDAANADAVGPVISRLLDRSQDPETLIACLKSRHLPLDRRHLPALLGHHSWQVRTQAARVMGRIGSRGDESMLIPLLSDPVWWVRYRAAQSLAQLPFLSRDDLWRLRGNLRDPFACDMLDQVISEGHAN